METRAALLNPRVSKIPDTVMLQGERLLPPPSRHGSGWDVGPQGGPPRGAHPPRPLPWNRGRRDTHPRDMPGSRELPSAWAEPRRGGTPPPMREPSRPPAQPMFPHSSWPRGGAGWNAGPPSQGQGHGPDFRRPGSGSPLPRSLPGPPTKRGMSNGPGESEQVQLRSLLQLPVACDRADLNDSLTATAGPWWLQ